MTRSAQAWDAERHAASFTFLLCACKIREEFADVAQLVEQLIRNQ